MTSSRQLAAIMFTDIVGYTALMGQSEEKAMQLVHRNREIQKPLIEKYRGQWLKEMGDGAMSSFPTASHAIYCALGNSGSCPQFRTGASNRHPPR